jgi:hypothetical protein
MKYRIKFFADFASSVELKNTYENICETDKMDNYGEDKDIYITEHDDYTHAIIINLIMPELKDIPKNNVVGLAHEPTIFFIHLINRSYTPSIFFYAVKHIGKYFMGDRVFIEPFIEHFSYMPYNKPLSYIPIKNKLMSIIISEKNDQWFGYNYRYKMVDLILQNNLPIDIYGRGSTQFLSLNNNNHNNSIKGEFIENEPYEDYAFHICIENFACERYFSEKIINPLLTNAVPIYLGCRHIKEYFGDNVIEMCGNIEKDIHLIVDIINYPEKYRRNIDVDAIKQKVSLLHNLDSIFS